MLHGRDKIFDWSVPAARDAWLATAQRALSQPYISGVFVDKAGGFGAKGVRRGRMRRWTSGHAQLLQALGSAAAAAKKRLIFNNLGRPGVAGQLFERWGAKEDHDGLSKPQRNFPDFCGKDSATRELGFLTSRARLAGTGLLQDLQLLETATGASNAGQLSLARAGGVAPGSANGSSAEVCGAGLAAMLLAVASPNAAFFSCKKMMVILSRCERAVRLANPKRITIAGMPDFNSAHGWMALGQDPIYKRFLGAPKGEALTGTDGLVTRAFAGATVSLNTSAFVAARNPTDAGLNRGCVRWASGEVTGVCP